MKDAGCIGNASHRPVGARAGGSKMAKPRLVIFLMALIAVIIIGIAVYLFTHLSTLTLTSVIIMVSVAVVSLLVIMGILFAIMRSITSNK
jgi:hypothetical protein